MSHNSPVVRIPYLDLVDISLTTACYLLQALLANMAAMYAIYHGPSGLKNISLRVHQTTLALAESRYHSNDNCCYQGYMCLVLHRQGHLVHPGIFFDTIKVCCSCLITRHDTLVVYVCTVSCAIAEINVELYFRYTVKDLVI